MSRIEVAVKKSLRADRRAFELDVRFESDADVTVLFGPSGAGKTLTLHAIAGLLHPDAGHIGIDGTVLFDAGRSINVAARKRRVGFVFQDYALFPHLSVLDNVAFGRRRGLLIRGGVDDETRAMLAAMHLESLAHAYPSDLSGGQRQRVALARALASRPQLLLLDEPFSALDSNLRERLRAELLDVRARSAIPMIVITHDMDDVAAFGGKRVVIEDGRVVG